MRRKATPTKRDGRDLMHDDRGVGTDRQTEDDQIPRRPERDGWNSNTEGPTLEISRNPEADNPPHSSITSQLTARCSAA